MSKRAKEISKFAHKCEKLKNSESIPRFLQTLEKSFALSDITNSKEKFRVIHFLIPPSVSAELPKGFNKIPERYTLPYEKAAEELKKIYDDYVVRCPIKGRLQFSWASHDKETSVYDFGKNFMTANNINP